MQIYDGNLLHILKPMTRKTWGEGASKATIPRSSTASEIAREIEADYRVRSRYLDLHRTTLDRFSEEIASPMIGVRRGEGRKEKEARR